MRRLRVQDGFSLIEMLVVVIIIAVVVTGVSLSIGATSKAKLRSSCWTLASAVRYAYSHSVTQGVTTRLVMDFDKRTIQLEETKGRVVLNREDETGEGTRREGDDLDGGVGKTLLDSKMDSIGSSFGGASGTSMSGSMGSSMGMGGMPMGMGGAMGALAGGGGMEMMGQMMGGRLTDPFLAGMQNGFGGNPAGYRRPRFKPLEGRRGEARSLKGNTIFVSVYTPHEPKPREEGRAFLYFFPGGYSEHTIIQLGDGDERIYSVEVHPLTGRPSVFPEAIEPEEELDDLQEATE